MGWIEMDLVWPIIGAVIAGVLIGIEREYRGSPAGIRTHTLVALSSSLLMIAAVHQIRWLNDTPIELIRIDPVRMAHGILTGIGFLGAGVIFKDGFTIRGLTSAASLWITSALGTLYGIGFYGLAVGGTLATLAVLAAVSITEDHAPQRLYVDITVRYRRDAGMTEARFREELARHGLKPGAVSQTLDGDIKSLTALFKSNGPLTVDALAAALGDDPAVLGFTLTPQMR